MYAISFPDKKLLKAWLENQEKVRKQTQEGELVVKTYWEHISVTMIQNMNLII